MKLLPLLFAVLFALSLEVVSAPIPYVYSVDELMGLQSLPSGDIKVKGRITRVIHSSVLIKNQPTKIELDKKLRCEVTISKGFDGPFNPAKFTFEAGMPVQITGVFVQKGDGVTLKGICIVTR